MTTPDARTEASARLACGYDAPATDRSRRKRAALARTFRPDARMERAIAMKASDPAAYAKLPPATKLAAGYYAAAKEAAAEADAAGHAAADVGADRERRKRAALARTFRPDARMERAIAMKASDPAAYAKLPPATKLAAGYYAAAKEAAADEEADR